MNIAIELADAQRAWHLAVDEEGRESAFARVEAVMAEAGHEKAFVFDNAGPGGRVVTVVWGVDGSTFT